MNKYILNPKTGRIVLQSGKIGQQILNTFSSVEIEQLKVLTQQRQQTRIKTQKCDYGLIWTSRTGNCINRKTEEGKKIVNCQKDKIKFVLSEFKSDKLIDKNKNPVKNKKQALAIALSEANRYC